MLFTAISHFQFTIYWNKQETKKCREQKKFCFQKLMFIKSINSEKETMYCFLSQVMINVMHATYSYIQIKFIYDYCEIKIKDWNIDNKRGGG